MRRNQLTETIAENLKRARLASSMTQEEVAKQSGITADYYSRIERGAANPSVAVLAALVKSLNTKSSKILPF